jgi:predicted DNA-binding transcriptional regulator AlpA
MQSDTDETTPAAGPPPGPPRLWDVDKVCAFFGGEDNPIKIPTLYNGMHAGRYPRPVNVGGNIARWLADECEATLAQMIANRDVGKQTANRKSRRDEPTAA